VIAPGTPIAHDGAPNRTESDMKLKYILTYGGISGAVVIATLMAGLLLGTDSVFSSVTFGYLVMLVAMTFIFVGVKRYRDLEQGGAIRFRQAFALGLGIAVMAGIVYVGAWEAYLASTNYAFIDQYIAQVMAGHEKAGMTAAALEEARREMDALRTQYAQPWFRLPMTFLEIFPVGLLVALISAALLRNPNLLPARQPAAAQRTGA
jgi:hypothetical protein